MKVTNMKVTKMLQGISGSLEQEVFQTLVDTDKLTIERIVSKGHTSPETGWYDQERDEWVMVLTGSARLEFTDGEKLTLSAGDAINIPAHTRHKVIWTAADIETVWLAVHYVSN